MSYDHIQFTKAPNVLRGMGLAQLTKNESAKKELAEKGMAIARMPMHSLRVALEVAWSRHSLPFNLPPGRRA